MARALNVVESTLIPAMPGTRTSSASWSPQRIAPIRKRKSSGRAKLKNAAEGLRQNMGRSRRYCDQARRAGEGSDMRGLGGGGELEVDVLEGGAGDGELRDAPAAGERRARQLVHERR